MKIAATGDLHITIDNHDEIGRILEDAARGADVLLLAGDLTNMGRVDEMDLLLRCLRPLSLPIVAVAGNHDHESDKLDILVEMMVSSGIYVLDGTSCEIEGIGFVGTKGFCGGFGKMAVQPFGEQALKVFIQTSIEESKRLEDALIHMESEKRVAIMHYAPIKRTLEGESPELFAFLGSSLLADALDRSQVDVVFHGHAHGGSPRGLTASGIPVYNVCRFVQERHSGQSFYMFEM